MQSGALSFSSWVPVSHISPWWLPFQRVAMKVWHSPQVSVMCSRETFEASSFTLAISCEPWQLLQLGATARPERSSPEPCTLLRNCLTEAVSWHSPQVETCSTFDMGESGSVLSLMSCMSP